MKIFIVGIVASGKTTLAKKLSAQYGIPYYEGDCIAWGFPGEERYKRTDEEQKNIILRINESDSWIIEGTPRKSQECILGLADKIIFLDTPLFTRKARIITRFIKQKIGLEKSNYKPTMEMLRLRFKWTGDFEANRAAFDDLLNAYKDKLIRIKSEKELGFRL